MKKRKWAGWLAFVAGMAAMLFASAPFAFAELTMAATQQGVNVMPAPVNPAQFRPLPGKAAGTVVDGYWRVEQIASD